jgi:GntR family transcriptional repressor for pyruvate dehydrogenase complex
MDALTPLRPVQRRKVHQEVAAQLEQLILSGRLREGDQLPSERELMVRFSVGRPAVREAMLTLEKNGLVRLSSGERARVHRPDARTLIDGMSAAARGAMATDEGMRHFQSARALFEIALVRHAAVHADAAQLAKLAEALRRNKAALGDTALFETTDVAFHYEIVVVARNPLFVGMHEALSGWLREQRRVVLEDAVADKRAYAFHARIFEAIAARDADLAERRMADHLRDVERRFWKVRAAERAHETRA